MPDYIHNKKLVSLARALRRNMTKEERRLWYESLRAYPIRFQRQKVFGGYILDFYCAKARLAVELDGEQHTEPEAVIHDTERTAFLESYGLTVLRIPNSEVNRNFTGVCEHIHFAVQQALKESEGHPSRSQPKAPLA